MKPRPSKNQNKAPLAIALISASFLSAFLLATFSNTKHDYWVATNDIPAGHQISTEDLHLGHMNLDASASHYLSKNEDPLGQVVVRNLKAGIEVGQAVDIYWVLDSDSGKPAEDPILILGGVLVVSADVKSKNFGTDAAITVAVEETQVLRLLSATTQGRLVVIRSHV